MTAFWELLKAFLYGVVEGISEWLPISSTGHLILLERILPMQVSEAFWDMFLVVVQLGAILAVVVLFWGRIFPFALKGGTEDGKRSLSVRGDVMQMWLKILVACIPGGLYAFLLDDIFDELFYTHVTVAVMLILVGIVFVVVETVYLRRGIKPKVDTLSGITWRAAVAIGLFQVIAAAFPGTSRSGATIIGGLLIGLSRTVAAEFTFFLAIPVMAGESLLRILDFGFAYTGMEPALLLVGTVTAFLVSLVVIRFLMDYIRRRDFRVFGWYRILLGVVVLLFFGVMV